VRPRRCTSTLSLFEASATRGGRARLAADRSDVRGLALHCRAAAICGQAPHGLVPPAPAFSRPCGVYPDRASQRLSWPASSRVVKPPSNIHSTGHLPVGSRRPAAPVRFLPFSTCGRVNPLSAGVPARFVPPPGFGHPPGGLLLTRPRRPFFMPAALLGFALQRLLVAAVGRHSCRPAPTRGLPSVRQPMQASTGRRTSPPLGFDPRRRPSLDRGV